MGTVSTTTGVYSLNSAGCTIGNGVYKVSCRTDSSNYVDHNSISITITDTCGLPTVIAPATYSDITYWLHDSSNTDS